MGAPNVRWNSPHAGALPRGSVIATQLTDSTLHQPERFVFRSTPASPVPYEVLRAQRPAWLCSLRAFMADSDPILACVLPKKARFTRTFWMSMPAEGKHLARMQAA